MIADANWTYVIPLRWIHVLCAGLLLGGTFLMAFLLPIGETGSDAPAAGSPSPRSRRGFKMLVHICTLLLLISGAYNSYNNWHSYGRLAQGLWGPHLLLGLIVLGILLTVLARKTPRPSERTWLRVAAVLIFVTFLVASSLKYVREHHL
jgi:putative copper export protein